MGAPVLHRGALTIAQRVEEMAAELDAELDDGAVVVGVLKGCLPFLADLTRRIAVSYTHLTLPTKRIV